MNLPAFTASASLYRTSNHYRSSSSELSSLPSTASVVAAYHPGPSTQARCNRCLQDCAFTLDNCLSFNDRWISWWNPAGLFLNALCYSDAADCRDQCANPPLGACCPKACGTRNPSDPSEGCCDKGDTCCDGTCCPSNLFCYGGGICGEPPPPGFPTTPPPPPPINNCIFGGAPCGGKCCPIGTVCCGVLSNGQPNCKLGSTTNACLH